MTGLMKVLLGLLSPVGTRARLSILIFHRVVPQRDPLFPAEVTRGEFDAICGWLRAWCNVLPLEQAVQALALGTLPSRAVAITFDDGYADNHDHALPVLQRHGLTATFFVASGFLDGGRMWNDSVIEAVRRAPAADLDLRGTEAQALGTLPLATHTQRRAAVDRLLSTIKYLPQPARDSWVEDIARRVGVELPDDLMMRSEQVRALHQAGMTIGAHTVSHPILRGLPPALARREIADNRAALEGIIDDPVRLFAYPNGRHGVDYDDDTVAVVRELGFFGAVTTNWAAARPGTDHLQLPRFTPWERSAARFGLRMAHTLATT